MKRIGLFIERRFTRFAFCGYAYQNYSLMRRAAFVHALELNHIVSESSGECEKRQIVLSKLF